jgi:hypothetical protein
VESGTIGTHTRKKQSSNTTTNFQSHVFFDWGPSTVPLGTVKSFVCSVERLEVQQKMIWVTTKSNTSKSYLVTYDIFAYSAPLSSLSPPLSSHDNGSHRYPPSLEAFEPPQDIHIIIFRFEPLSSPRPFICRTNSSSHGSANAAK